MSTFNKDTHIIGKVYDLNQKNMNLMLDYINELQSFIREHEFYTAKEFECMKRDMCEGVCDVCGGNAK